MGRERRWIDRKTPSELTYVQLGEDLGGIVWNASEAGLAFQSAAPLHGAKSISVCISPNPSKRIDLMGTLAWTDATDRFGGLQFNEVTAATLKQLRNWLGTGSGPEAAEQDVLPSTQEGLPVQRSTDVQGTKLDRSPFDPPNQFMPSSDPPSPSTTLRFGQAHSASYALWPEHRERGRPSAAMVLFICAIAAAPVVVLRYFRSDVAHSLIRMGQVLQRSGPASGSPPSIPASDRAAPFRAPSGPTATDLEDSPFSVPRTSTESTANRGATDAGGSLQARSNQPADNGNHRIEGLVVNDRSAAAQTLWDALGRGDVSAEVSLAKLYLHGDGVPQSCQQARVLLKAASKSGNSEAAKLLKNFRKAGCR